MEKKAPLPVAALAVPQLDTDLDQCLRLNPTQQRAAVGPLATMMFGIIGDRLAPSPLQLLLPPMLTTTTTIGAQTVIYEALVAVELAGTELAGTEHQRRNRRSL